MPRCAVVLVAGLLAVELNMRGTVTVWLAAWSTAPASHDSYDSSQATRRHSGTAGEFESDVRHQETSPMRYFYPRTPPRRSTATPLRFALVVAAVASLCLASTVRSDEGTAEELAVRRPAVFSERRDGPPDETGVTLCSCLADSTTCDACGPACEDGCCECGDGCRELYVGGELLVFQPHLGTVTADTPGGPLRVTPDFDFDVSPRVWLGVRNDDGMGGRVRYWHYDHTSNAEGDLLDLVDVGGDLTLDLQVQALDVELSERGTFGSWDIEVSGGVRYGKLGLGFDALDTDLGDLGAEVGFEGVGLTVGVAGHRKPGRHGIVLYGGARGSLLYGHTDFDGRRDLQPLLAGLDLKVDDHVMQVWEVYMGAEVRHTLRNGCQLFATGGVEGQVWEWAPALGLLGADIGFVGPTMSLGFIR